MVNVLAEVSQASESRTEAVAYEIALEGAGQVIGFYTELIAREEAAGQPDTDAIAGWRAEQQGWAIRRRELTPRGTQEIDAIYSDGEDLLAGLSDEGANRQREQVLEDAENERIFRDQIVPDELTGTPQDHPVVVIVGGQPGDGKAMITALVSGVLNRRGRPVTINLDRYEPRRPGFRTPIADEPTTAEYVSTDGRRWMAKAATHARSQRLDVVLESTLLDPGDLERQAREFKAAGYQVELAIVAVHEAVSRLGGLDRYIRALEVFGYGRLADPELHDNCYRGVLRAAEAIDRDDFADRVAAFRPDGELIYGNQRTGDGRWQQPAGAAEAISRERGRSWTVAESRRFLDAVSELRQIGVTAPVPWIRRTATEGARTVTALTGSRLHPDAVTLNIATAGL